MKIGHAQNLSDGKLPLWRHGRAWFFGYRLTIEWLAFMRSRLGVGVSSTGFSIRLLFFALYVSLDRDGGGLGRRELDLYWNDGCLWISHPFERDGGMEHRSADPWWKKVIVLHVSDWLRGRAKYERIEGKSSEVLIPMPEGCYIATATPERVTFSYRWYWPKVVRESVWLQIPGGIPHSGKGENSWDCGDDGLFGIGGDTLEDAIANAMKSSLKSRRRYGLDSARTGENPIRIVNEAAFTELATEPMLKEEKP